MANKKVKYKLIQEVVIDNLIAFLDEIQFESSLIENEESINKMNFCSWALKELVNAYPISEIVNMDDVLGRDTSKKKNDKRNDIIDEYFLDWELPEDMSDEEFEKLIAQFDGFLKGWERKYKKSNSKKRGKRGKREKNTSHFNRPLIEDISDYMTLDEIKEYLLDDAELTDSEKFDLYYEQYLRVKKYEETERAKSTLNKILGKIGIKKNT